MCDHRKQGVARRMSGAEVTSLGDEFTGVTSADPGGDGGEVDCHKGQCAESSEGHRYAQLGGHEELANGMKCLASTGSTIDGD